MSLARRARRLVPVLALSLVPAYGFVAVDLPAAVDEEPSAKSDNLEHIKNLPYADGANAGTDLEFADVTLDDEQFFRLGFTALDDADGDPTNGFQRTYSFAGSYQNGLQIVDVTDPENAGIVAVYECGISQGDVQVFERDGGTYVTYTMDSGYTANTKTQCYAEAEKLGQYSRKTGTFGTFIADVSDPYNPTTVSFVPIAKGSHNQTVHPSGDYLYNSNSDLITTILTAGIEVYDIKDLANPRHVTTLALPKRPGLGTESHDLTFNSEGTRAYSAALSQTVIINTEDPEDPSVISSFMDPAINVEHQSSPVTITDQHTGLTREFLIVEDEFAGAAGGEQTCPSGGVHVYDITDQLERAPVKVGYWNIDDLTTTKAAGFGRCTAHVFELHEEEALMTIAFYNLGVSVVDLSNLIGVGLGGNSLGMKEVAYAEFDDSDTWAVKAPYVDRDGTFYMYGNDQKRGMDIYRIALDLPPVGETAGLAYGTGRDAWRTPREADRFLIGRVTARDGNPYSFLDDLLLGERVGADHGTPYLFLLGLLLGDRI